VKFSKEIRVGLLVTGALAALLWGMNYLKGIDVFSKASLYYAVYPNVDGLTPSSDVLMSGVKIGQVQKIKFLEDRSGYILATLRINGDVYISKTSIARIVSVDLLGGKAVNIILDPGTEAAVNGDTLKAEVETTLSAQVMPIKDKAESLIASLDTLAVSLNAVVGSGNRNNLNSTIQNLDKTLANIERASGSLDRMLSSDQSKLNRMLANIESITANIRNNNEALGQALKNISAISDSLSKSNLTSTVNNADLTLREASIILNKINKGEGTMGMLINNDSLYRALEQSAVDLDKLLVDLKANPGRYVRISVFGGKSK
jgi:phospholipid/cholesterol/gamma-HCH transport system substrate-binding protein